ncbi:MAG: hypothetical protein R3325_10590 [Thermoanaerobaculia bacterium]|nr:hypothetical protein [Thermoanaerobaculia bacterium]
MRRERLQTVVSIAEIVSALAVVVSLVYVAHEFRRSQTLTSTDVQTALYERMLEMDRLLIESPGLAEVLVAADGDPEALAPADRRRFQAYEHIFYDTWELAWTAHTEGVLEEAAWQDWGGWFAAEARRRPPLGWTANRENHSEAFLLYVEGRLRGD